MKAFHCDGCGNLVFFDSVTCVKCGRALGFLPFQFELSALEPGENGIWRALAPAVSGQSYRLCNNSRDHQVCNWLVPADAPASFCISCGLNQTIPNLNIPGNLERWRRLEMAKRRVVYSVLQLGLPMDGKSGENPTALQFRFLSDTPGGPVVRTGHENGLITINVAEADDDERERRRVSLHEPYRTLVGHFRHEIAHYYWDRLIANSPWLARWRQMFGDERQDYGATLSSYHRQGAPADWQSRFVSAYASAHPWEDWAETWAHYFHIIDTVETAASFGMTLKPRHPAAKAMTTNPQMVDETNSSFDRILEHWFPLTYALNALNRGMGLHDLYPFVLSNPAIEKLRFVHEVVKGSRTANGAANGGYLAK